MTYEATSTLALEFKTVGAADAKRDTDAVTEATQKAEKATQDLTAAQREREAVLKREAEWHASLARRRAEAAAAAEREAAQMREAAAATGASATRLGALVPVIAGVVAGVAAAGTAFAGAAFLVKGFASEMDALKEAAAGAGVTALTLAELNAKASDFGVKGNEMARVLGTLSGRIEDAADGTGRYAKLFDALGIAVVTGAGKLKSADAVLAEIADRFAGMASATEKAALARELFGRGGAKFVEYLSQGSAALKENAGLTEASIEAGVRLEREWEKLGSTVSRAWNDVRGSMARDINQLMAGDFSTGLNPFAEWTAALQDTLPDVERKLADARAEMAELAAEAAKKPDNLMLREMLRDAQRVVAELEAAKRGLDAIAAQPGINRMGSGIRAIREADESAEIRATVQDLAAYNEMVTRSAGLTKNYAQELALINKLRQLSAADMARHGITHEQLNAAAKRLIGTTQAGKDATAAAAKAMREAEADAKKYERAIAGLDGEMAKFLADMQKVVDADLARRNEDLVKGWTDADKAAEEYRASIRAAAADNTAAADSLRQQTAELTMTAAAIAEATARRLENTAAERDALALAAEETDFRRADAYRQEAAALRDRAAAIRDNAAAKAEFDARLADSESLDRFSDNLAQAITDGMVRGFQGGESFGKVVANSLKAEFGTLLADGLRGVLSGAIRGGASGLASGLFGGGSGSGGSILGSIGQGVIGSGAFGAGLWSGLSGAGSMAAASGLLGLGTASGAGAGLGMAAGVAAPYLAAAYAAYRVISGSGTGRDRAPGYQQYGLVGDQGFGYAANTPNLALGGAGYYEGIVRPIADAVADAVQRLGGTVGRTTYGLYTSTGSEGSGAYLRADVGGASGMVFQTESNADNASLEARISAALPKMLLAGLLDSDLDSVFADYFSSIDISSATEESVAAAIDAAVSAHQFAVAVAELGANLAALPGIAVDAQIELVQMMGGLDSALSAVAAYQREFFTATEQEAALRKQLADALGAVNLSLPTTRDEFRQLVEAQDLSTESGRKAFAVLMAVSGSFAALVPAAAGAEESVGDMVEALRSAADIAREREGLESRLMELEGDRAGLRERELAALDPSNRSLAERIFAIEDEREAAEAARQALDAMMASAGLSASAISDLLRDGLLGRISSEDLGGQLGELIVGGIQQALASQFADSITTAFTDAIVAPILTAVLTGGEIASAVSQQSIDAVVEAAGNAAQAFAAVLSDPSFTAAMESIRAAVAGITSAVAAPSSSASGGPTVPAGWSTWVDQNGQVNWSSTTAPQTSSTSPDASAGGDDGRAAAEAYRLTTQLLQVLGDTTQLRARELELLDPSNRALQELIWVKQDEIAANEASARAAADAAAAQQSADMARYDQAQRFFSEGRDLEVQYLLAIGEEEQALAKAREFAVAGMDAELTAYYDANAATRALIETMREEAASEQRRAAENESLQARLWQLQGNTAALREAELAALDPANRSMQELIWTLEDAAAAADVTARQAAETAAEEQRIASEEESLTARLNQLNGDTVAIRQAELDSVDESNRALLQSIHVREDELAVEREAEALASRNYDLQTRILQLQGDTEALREREVEGLDETTIALLEQIWLLEDAADAQRVKNDEDRIAAGIAAEKYGLETRLLNLLGDTAAIRERELAALDESNRSLLQQIYNEEDRLAAAREAEEAARASERAQEEAMRQAEEAQRQLMDGIKSVFDLLTSSVRDLLGEAGAGMTAGEGMAFLNSALDTARLTGALPDEDQLAAAISAARQGTSNALFATRAEADFARLSLAGTLSQLADIAGRQLGIAAGGTPAAAGFAALAAAAAPTASQPALPAFTDSQAGIRAELQAIAQHTAKVARILDRVTPTGDAVVTTTA